MTHAALTVRIVISLANLGTYLYWRRDVRRQDEKTARHDTAAWLFTAIRGDR